MKSRLIHENLDTSFVNLSALIRYLRRRHFIGGIRVELNGYEAEITLSEGNKMQVREQDHLAGRIAEGEEALQRLLIRAREPGGIINVYQQINEPLGEKTLPVNEVPELFETSFEKPVLEITPVISTNGSYTNGAAKTVLKKEETEEVLVLPNEQTANEPLNPITVETPKPAEKSSPPSAFPFELSNKMEEKAKNTQLSTREWQTLLQLTGELLNTVDKSLAEAKLDFVPALRKARIEISGDYPFLHPVSGCFIYSHGKITMGEQVNAKLFVSSLNESLRRILEKLGSNPKFTFVYRSTVQRIISLINQRKAAYENYAITPQLAKIVGI